MQGELLESGIGHVGKTMSITQSCVIKGGAEWGNVWRDQGGGGRMG